MYSYEKDAGLVVVREVIGKGANRLANPARVGDGFLSFHTIRLRVEQQCLKFFVVHRVFVSATLIWLHVLIFADYAEMNRYVYTRASISKLDSLRQRQLL